MCRVKEKIKKLQKNMETEIDCSIYSENCTILKNSAENITQKM